jgi:hypothetical protein
MNDYIEFVGWVDGILTVPLAENGGASRESASNFAQFYGTPEACEFYAEGGCSDDNNLWSVHDMGSPYFCTNHYFPQEQLGYEFIAEKETK